jgi:hypothetical protein
VRQRRRHARHCLRTNGTHREAETSKVVYLKRSTKHTIGTQDSKNANDKSRPGTAPTANSDALGRCAHDRSIDRTTNEPTNKRSNDRTSDKHTRIVRKQRQQTTRVSQSLTTTTIVRLRDAHAYGGVAGDDADELGEHEQRAGCAHRTYETRTSTSNVDVERATSSQGAERASSQRTKPKTTHGDDERSCDCRRFGRTSRNDAMTYWRFWRDR